MNTCAHPFANPLLETSEFDSDAKEPMVLCAVPSKDDEPVRFAVPAVYLDLVREFDGNRTIGEAIDAFLEHRPGRYQKEWLERLVESSLLPKGILIYAHQDPGGVAVSSQPKRAFLFIKLPIIKPNVVDPIARRLGFMFRREALIAGLILFVASHAYVYGVLIREAHVSFNELNTLAVIALMWLSTAGTIFHEFGHASAAAHYGCRKMTIGWGLYLIYTVLWTNVSDAWKLPRRQRAVVDIGGVYFESIFLLIMLGLYLYTGQVVFLFSFVFIDMSIAKTFNPFLRMDGYWLMSDLFGIVNLRTQQAVWLRGIAARALGGRSEDYKNNLTPKAQRALGIYTVLGAGFMAFILVMIFKFVILGILLEYPALVIGYWNTWQSGTTVFAFLLDLSEIGWRAMMLFGAGFMIVNLVKTSIRVIARLRAIRLEVRQHNA